MNDNDRRRAFDSERRKQIKRRTALLTDTRAEIVRLLNDARDRVLVTLAGQPSDYQRWYLPQLKREVEATLTALSNDSGAAITKAAGDAWELGRELVDAPLEAAQVRVLGVAPVLDTR